MATPCSSDWNALISTEQYGSTNPSSYNPSPLSSNYGMFEQIMRPAFNNLSFPEVECSFDLSPERQTNSAHYTPDFFFISKHCNERSIKGGKRESISETSSLKSSETKDEKNEKAESSTGLGISKSASKQAEEVYKDGDSTKQEYMHVRAKRGQAINRHSLAERVRREKISERMRVLQDLVPGCNKITGKAVMLDEIINYVQSLQQQIGFLSMKLAAVHPQLRLDDEQIFPKDVQLPGRSPAILGLCLGPNAQYHQFHGHGGGQVQLETLMTTTMPQLSTMSQMPHVWDEELQNATKMVFIPHHSPNHCS